MNTQQLKCFLAVAENLSYARAARELYLTQPTVTHQIQSLERELNVRLFHRTKHNVSLTQEGMIFYEDARAILAREHLALSRLQYKGPLSNPILSFGFCSSVEMYHFAPVLSKLSKNISFHPYLRLLPKKSFWNQFLTTDLDCVFSYRDSQAEMAEIRIADLFAVGLVCLLPKVHPLANQKKLALPQLADCHFIFCNPSMLPMAAASMENELMSLLPPSHIYHCETIEATLALAASGLGIAILPDNLCAGTENTIKIPLESDCRMTYSLFMKQETSETKLMILNEIKSCWTQEQRKD